MRTIYLILAILGTVGPWIFFGQFFAEPGTTMGHFIAALGANPATTGAAVDLVISSVVFWLWSFPVARRLGMRWWPYPVVNLLIGLSCALPLFLFFREGRPAQESA